MGTPQDPGQQGGQPAVDKQLDAETLLGKLIVWIIPATAALFTGVAGWQTKSGEYYGSMLFSGMKSALSLSVPTQYLLNGNLYSSWSAEIISGPLGAARGLGPVLALLLLVVLVLHVHQKPSRDMGLGAGKKGLRRFYVRHYSLLTVTALFGVLVGVFTVSQPFWLVSLAASIVVTAILYAFYYRGDVRSGRRTDRFTLATVLLYLVVVVVGLPYIYGRHAFDLRLRPVNTLAGGVDASNTFVFAERDSILGRVTPSEAGFSIVLFPGKKGFSAASSDVSLRRWIVNYSALPRSDSAAAVASLQGQLSNLTWAK